MRYAKNALGASLLFFLLACSTHSTEPKTASKPSVPVKLEKAKIGTIYNVHRFGKILLAGQPKPEDFALLKKMGIKTVIQMNYRERLPFNEEALAKSHGMNYVYLPWNGPKLLTDEVYDRTRKLLNDSEKPLLLHCASANRVGAIWLVWRVLDGGIPLEQAIAEAKEVGMRTPGYLVRAKEYLAKHGR